MRRSSLRKSVLCLLLCCVLLCAACGREAYAPTPGEDLPQTPFFAVPATGAAAGDAASLVLPFNAVYRYFGGIDAENCRVYRFGNEPTYYEWVAQKIAWTGDEAYLRELKDKIVDFPQTDNGYLWSWGTSVYWPTGKGELHYDGLFRYVAAVASLGVRTLCWRGAEIALEVGADSLTLSARSPLSGVLRFIPVKAETYTVCLTAADGTRTTFSGEAADTPQEIPLTGQNVVCVEIF